MSGVRVTSIAATFILALIAGCEFIDPNPGPSPLDDDGTGYIDVSPPSVEKGASLYASNCERCHGAEAEGTVIWPSPIWRFEDPADIIINGGSAMPAFPTLSDSQIVSLNLFLSASGPAPTDDPATNFQRFCEGCHGAGGAGGPLFPSSIQGHLAVSDVVRSGRGRMPEVSVGRLSNTALDSLADYIERLADMSSYSGTEYYAFRCAGCHGFQAEGTDRGYPLQRPVRDYAEYVIREGRPGIQFPSTMPAYTSLHLSDAQLDELLDFLGSIEKPTSGADLYGTYCANCHGPSGRGGPAESDLTAALGDAQAFLTAVRSGNGGSRYWNRTDYMPSWDSTELSDADVQAIIAYLQTL